METNKDAMWSPHWRGVSGDIRDRAPKACAFQAIAGRHHSMADGLLRQSPKEILSEFSEPFNKFIQHLFSLTTHTRKSNHVK